MTQPSPAAMAAAKEWRETTIVGPAAIALAETIDRHLAAERDQSQTRYSVLKQDIAITNRFIAGVREELDNTDDIFAAIRELVRRAEAAEQQLAETQKLLRLEQAERKQAMEWADEAGLGANDARAEAEAAEQRARELEAEMAALQQNQTQS